MKKIEISLNNQEYIGEQSLENWIIVYLRSNIVNDTHFFNLTFLCPKCGKKLCHNNYVITSFHCSDPNCENSEEAEEILFKIEKITEINGVVKIKDKM